MEGDHGLAGAGPALDHEDAGQLGTDDLVLLGLDRGHDVAQPTGAGRLERGHQGVAAGDLGPGADEGLGVAEDLVLDAQQGPAPDREVPAAGEAHRVATGGPVEGLGHGRPPVDDHRVLVLVGHGDATDVEIVTAVLLVTVDPPEDERGVSQVEAPQAVGDAVVHDLPLPAGLLGATPSDLDGVRQPGGRRAAGLEALVGALDVGLFGVEVGVIGHEGVDQAYGLRRGSFDEAIR